MNVGSERRRTSDAADILLSLPLSRAHTHTHIYIYIYIYIYSNNAFVGSCSSHLGFFYLCCTH